MVSPRELVNISNLRYSSLATFGKTLLEKKKHEKAQKQDWGGTLANTVQFYMPFHFKNGLFLHALLFYNYIYLPYR